MRECILGIIPSDAVAERAIGVRRALKRRGGLVVFKR